MCKASFYKTVPLHSLQFKFAMYCMPRIDPDTRDYVKPARMHRSYNVTGGPDAKKDHCGTQKKLQFWTISDQSQDLPMLESRILTIMCKYACLHNTAKAHTTCLF